MLPLPGAASPSRAAVTAVAPLAQVAAADTGAGAPGGKARGGARPAGDFARALDRASAARDAAPRTGTPSAATAHAGAAHEHRCANAAPAACSDPSIGEDLEPNSSDKVVVTMPPPSGADIDTHPATAVPAEAGAAARLLSELHALRAPAAADAAAA